MESTHTTCLEFQSLLSNTHWAIHSATFHSFHFAVSWLSKLAANCIHTSPPSISTWCNYARHMRVCLITREWPSIHYWYFYICSMPYAQVHYPFENQKEFERSFPADFIAEGIDQTRGWWDCWKKIHVVCFSDRLSKFFTNNIVSFVMCFFLFSRFYTLVVISTALFDEPPFKNLIVNGLVLAAWVWCLKLITAVMLWAKFGLLCTCHFLISTKFCQASPDLNTNVGNELPRNLTKTLSV